MMKPIKGAYSNTAHRICRAVLCLPFYFAVVAAQGQSVLFDFDSAPLHSSLPLDLSQGGINAHFSSSMTGNGYGFSIQDPLATILLVPAGFSGYAICPNGVYATDLLVSFNVALSDFSIMVAPQVLACDTTATLRVTGYLGAALAGTATSSATTDPPYMWPSSILTLVAPAGFDNVVVHYDSPPPPPCDYGSIFVADNMSVTQLDTIFANGFE